ncbi:MAG: hypothetical protein ACR2LR_25200 [Hassallia sp.]
MFPKDCPHDCESNHCPFAQDTHNPNRYVCLKCGFDRQIDRNPFDFGSFLLLIFTMLVIVSLLANDGKQGKKLVPEKPKSSSFSSIIL